MHLLSHGFINNQEIKYLCYDVFDYRKVVENRYKSNKSSHESTKINISLAKAPRTLRKKLVS